MIEGRPLFMGLCEIDQLFQIFFKMGTPTMDVWPAFTEMPNYQVISSTHSSNKTEPTQVTRINEWNASRRRCFRSGPIRSCMDS